MTEVASRTGPVHTFTVFSDGTKREKNNQKTILRQEVKRLNAQVESLEKIIKKMKDEAKKKDKIINNKTERFQSAYNLMTRVIETQKIEMRRLNKEIKDRNNCCTTCRSHALVKPSDTLYKARQILENESLILGDQEDDKTYAKEEFYAEIGLVKRSEVSGFSRMKIINTPADYSNGRSAYPNDEYRKLSRHRNAKAQSQPSTISTSNHRRTEWGIIRPAASQSSSPPPKKIRKYLAGPWNTKDETEKITETKIEISVEEPEVNCNHPVNKKEEVDDISEENNTKYVRKEKKQSKRLKTVARKNDRRNKAKLGRPVGSRTNRNNSGPDLRLAKQYELAGKGSLKFHEAYTGKQNGPKEFECWFCENVYTVRQMVRFHVEKRHFEEAAQKWEELNRTDPNLFKYKVQNPNPD